MKKLGILILISTLLPGIALADLSDFPEPFAKDGKFNGVIVVANHAPASDVIAQSNLAQFFAIYLGGPLAGSTKLSSEVNSMDQNIVSIGSPCYNPVSAKILNNPSPCDKDLEAGKAYIKFAGNGFAQIVVAGYSDKGTREAVNSLIDYQSKGIDGNTYFVSVDEPSSAPQTKAVNEQGEEEQEDNAEITAINQTITDGKQKIIEELNKKIVDNTKENNTKAAEVKAETQKEVAEETQNREPAIEEEAEQGIIERILNWLKSLFSYNA